MGMVEMFNHSVAITASYSADNTEGWGRRTTKAPLDGRHDASFASAGPGLIQNHKEDDAGNSAISGSAKRLKNC